jgi:hypothetical protein
VPDRDVIVTFLTGILEPHVLVDEQTAGLVVEPFTDVLAEFLAYFIAAGTQPFGFRKGVLDAFAFQVAGELLAAALTLFIRAVVRLGVVGSR